MVNEIHWDAASVPSPDRSWVEDEGRKGEEEEWVRVKAAHTAWSTARGDERSITTARSFSSCCCRCLQSTQTGIDELRALHLKM